MIDSRANAGACRTWIARIVLRDRLHRPFQVVPGDVLHVGAKVDSRRISFQPDGAHELDPGAGIGRARKFDFALLPFRNLSKGKRAVVDHIRAAGPVLLVVVAFGQEPDLVAAVVEPFARARRQILSLILRIHEEVGCPAKTTCIKRPPFCGTTVNWTQRLEICCACQPL